MFVQQCNQMDEVWVPTKFSRDVLSASGEGGGDDCTGVRKHTQAC